MQPVQNGSPYNLDRLTSIPSPLLSFESGSGEPMSEFPPQLMLDAHETYSVEDKEEAIDTVEKVFMAYLLWRFTTLWKAAAGRPDVITHRGKAAFLALAVWFCWLAAATLYLRLSFGTWVWGVTFLADSLLTGCRTFLFVSHEDDDFERHGGNKRHAKQPLQTSRGSELWEFVVMLGILAFYPLEWAWAKLQGKPRPKLL